MVSPSSSKRFNLWNLPGARRQLAPVRTLVIADHPVIFSTLEHFVDGVGAYASVVAASSAEDVRLALADESQFDLVLLDLQMSGAQGLGLLIELRIDHPTLPIVAVSAPHALPGQARATSLPLTNLVPGQGALIDVAQHASLPGSPASPHWGSPSQVEPRRAGRGDPKNVEHDFGAAKLGMEAVGVRGPLGLTRRQTEVLKLMMQGQPNKQIARDLDLSVETVKDHVAAIFRALKVSSRTQAVVVASRITGRCPL